MPTAEEAHVDPTATVDPSSRDDDVEATVTPPLSLCAMLGSFMTTQVARG